MTGWPANPKLVRHHKSTLIWTGVHMDEAIMGLSVHTDEDGGGDNPLLVAIATPRLLSSFPLPVPMPVLSGTVVPGDLLTLIISEKSHAAMSCSPKACCVGDRLNVQGRTQVRQLALTQWRHMRRT